jgi:phosphoserine phosphatase RsbU/P
VTSIRRPVDTAELLEREIELAREIQLAALPASMPAVAGYDGAGLFRPAGPTGGDLFDFVRLPDARLLLLLGDATGHGLGPALSATQVTAMVRVALRLGATLDQTFRHVNDQLVEDLPADRFVTAFLGLLDPRTHAVHYHSAGQGPLLHYRAAANDVAWHGPSTFPLGAMPQPAEVAAQTLELAPGDLLALISDGLFEHPGPGGATFGETRVAELLRARHAAPMQALADELLAAARDWAAGTPQADDVTILLLRRLPG